MALSPISTTSNFKYETSSENQPVIHATLPVEIFEKILSYLTEKQILCNMSVCEQWNMLNVATWRRKFFLLSPKVELINNRVKFLCTHAKNDQHRCKINVYKIDVSQISNVTNVVSSKQLCKQKEKGLINYLPKLDAEELDRLQKMWVESKTEPKDFKYSFLNAKANKKPKENYGDFVSIAQEIFEEFRALSVTGKDEKLLLKYLINAVEMIPEGAHPVLNHYNVMVTVDYRLSLMESIFRTLIRQEKFYKGVKYCMQILVPYVKKHNPDKAFDELRNNMGLRYDLMVRSTVKNEKDVCAFEFYCYLLNEYKLTDKAISLAGKIDVAEIRMKVLTNLCKSLVQNDEIHTINKAIEFLRAERQNAGHQNIDPYLSDISNALAELGEHAKAVEVAGLISDESTKNALIEKLGAIH